MESRVELELVARSASMLFGLHRARWPFLRGLFLNRSFQLADFGFRQPAGFPRRQVERKRTVPDATNLLHMMADLLEHLAQLAILAFGQRDLIPGIRGFLNYADLRRRRAGATVRCSRPADGYSSAEAVNRSFVRLAADLHQVRFRHVRTGLHKFVREIAVVGHQKEPFALVVEASDGIEAGVLMANKFRDCGAAFGIGDSGHVAARLVDHQIKMALRSSQEFA